MSKIIRRLENKLLASLDAFSVVYLAGPRQSGKSTLAKHIASTGHPAHYLTFDDLQVRSAAEHDPMAFLRSLKGPVVLDEIQLVPALFRPLKMIVDELREQETESRGKFFLTGSASIMALPALSDALVGRMVLHTLYPFASSELETEPRQTFIDRVFSDDWTFAQLPPKDLTEIMLHASFPELLPLKSQDLRYRWCNGYIDTILQKDVRALIEIEKIGLIPELLQILAARTGSLLNETSLSRDVELNQTTTKKYRTLLEGLFMILSIPAWSTNLGKRVIKSPKIYLGDLNLLSYLIKTNFNDLAQENKTLYGQVVENYVAIELTKQLEFSDSLASLYHYRATSGQEVDFILEGPENRIVAIEVKSKSKVSADDFKHLMSFKTDLGEKFLRGFVLYAGDEIIPFGENLWAVPLSYL